MVDQLKLEIANFFYFSLLNESVAVEAASKTFSQLKSKQIESESIQTQVDQWEVVRECMENYRRFLKKARFSSSVLTDAGWQIPKDVDQGMWRHFVRDAEEEEYLAVIWSAILNYGDRDIARGLDVSQGTVRHRAGRGLRKLGAMGGGQL